jgi:hypothetical protein
MQLMYALCNTYVEMSCVAMPDQCPTRHLKIARFRIPGERTVPRFHWVDFGKDGIGGRRCGAAPDGVIAATEVLGAS